MIFIDDAEAPGGLELTRNAVSKVAGVFDVEANHVSRLLTFEYDQDKITIEQIQGVIEKTIQEARSQFARDRHFGFR